MLKKLILGNLLLALLVGVGSAVAQEGDLQAEMPVLVTSSGQALDAFTVQMLLGRAGIENTYDELAEADDITEYGTVVIAFGASIKGFGSAGITAETELARTQAIIDTAKEQGIAVIGVHIGGEERRGGLSEQFVQLVATNADYLIVTEAGNRDGYFDEVAEQNGTPLVLISQPLDTGTAIAELF